MTDVVRDATGSQRFRAWLMGFFALLAAALAGLGAAAGLGIGWLITRQLSALLYQVAPGDPVVLGFSTLIFLGVALLACWVPARRATRADPALVLRGE